jgi:hypothetical protein
MEAMRNSEAPHTDFGFLRGVIPTNPLFMPSNVDMMIERRGKFLIGEWKRPLEKISKGQEILLRRLAEQKNFSVIIIEGHSDHTGTEVVAIKRFDNEGNTWTVAQGIDGLKKLIRDWYNKVEGKS